MLLDLGKVLLHPSFGQLPQWAVVGDTFPVGCAFDECNVHHKVSIRADVCVQRLVEDIS